MQTIDFTSMPIIAAVDYGKEAIEGELAAVLSAINDIVTSKAITCVQFFGGN
jgi:hypothetical protein